MDRRTQLKKIKTFNCVCEIKSVREGGRERREDSLGPSLPHWLKWTQK